MVHLDVEAKYESVGTGPNGDEPDGRVWSAGNSAGVALSGAVRPSKPGQ